jgi:hypothetical protein
MSVNGPSDSTWAPGDASAGSPAPAKSSAKAHGGRIVEVRVRRLGDLDDVACLNAQVHEAIRRAGPGALIYADHRFASPVGRDVADAWARGMRAGNRGVAHSAILLDPDNATFNLQLERIVRCTGHSDRRVFRCRVELQQWLESRMTDDERELLCRLLR